MRRPWSPVAFFGDWLPQGVQRAAELAVGLLIMALAVRLIRRWRAGAFHAHVHAHGGVVHRHLHAHDERHAARAHDHEHVRIRSPVQAYGIGLVHGVGGSAAVGVLLLASIRDHVDATLALLLFAAAAALSMGTLSLGLGLALGTEPARRRFVRLAPALGSLSFLFGAWYAAAAFL